MATIAITDGIGRAAARRLLGEGHTVVLHARSGARGAPVAEELGRLGDVRLVTGDLADLDEVRALADQLGDLDVLVHNAGVWPSEGAPPSRQGHELAFAVNALAPHLLTALRVGAVDPGWVRTKLASPGAPGDVEDGGARVARAAAGEWAGGYTAGSSRARTPRALEDAGLQDRGRCSGRRGTGVRGRPVAARIAASTAGPEEMLGASPTPRRPYGACGSA